MFLALLFNLIGAFLLFISIKKDDRIPFDNEDSKKNIPVAKIETSKAKLGIFLLL
jgi:hypothetical protein